MIPPATDLATSRARVLAAAEEAGATLATYPHPLAGPDGEPLSTDTARFGAPPGQARSVLLVSSGLHGVEGHAGSGVQELLLASGRLRALPDDVAVVLVHAVNPYGFAWSRRVDHENIDVNRNFVDYSDLPENPRYADVDPILNPTTEIDPDDRSFLGELLAFWGEVGDDVAFRTISGGQYTHPAGVQFGGTAPSWSRRTLEQVWERELAGAAEAVALDVHTGLGPLGRLTVFQTADADEAAAEVGASWFPEHVYRSDRGGNVDHGLMGPGLDEWAAGRLATASFVLEVGTHDPTEGVTVFRADNWLHHHGDPRSAVGRRIRQQVRDFFFVDDPGWRADVADQVLGATTAVLDASCTMGG